MSDSKTIVLCLITGIVPIFCEEIFKGIDEKKQGGDQAQYEVLAICLTSYDLGS